MNTDYILIAESGSTKTDWCLVNKRKKKYFETQGINPYFLDDSSIAIILANELKINFSKQEISQLFFYGAGISDKDQKNRLTKVLKSYTGIKKVQVESDMLAAARATAGKEKGIVCIMGTGSNTCLYNGKSITFKTPSLGYVLGDEGGGSNLGKRVLQYYLHGIFDKDLQAAFDKKFQMSTSHILTQLYSKSFPNRFLAGFASFVFENRAHYMIENIAEDSINELFTNHIIRYPNIHKTPIHFVGSVAFLLQDIIENYCKEYDIKLGTVIQKPLKGLIKYHNMG